MKQAPTSLLTTFSRNMRRIREEKGLSQEDLAALSGIDRTYLSGCERCLRNPTVRTIEKLAKALKVTAGELLNEHETT